MELKVLTKEEIDKDIKNRIVNLINEKPNCVLGLATGSSPLGVYALLVKEHNLKHVSFEKVKSFNLDEYYVIEETSDQSYHYYMNEHLFSKIDIKKNNTHFPSLDNNYDELIKKAGGIDFQILGIGRNGHIGFNEPGTPFDSLTHMVDLDQTTIADNARFFNSIVDVPTRAITMGLATIMKAKEIVIIAVGKKKIEPLKKLLSKKVSVNFPASILNNHPDVTIYTDEETYKHAKL